MAGQNFYLITALEPLAGPPAEPPITPAELREHVSPSPSATERVDVVLLGDDLLQREAFLAGELDGEDVRPAVLEPAQVRNEAALPRELSGGGSPADARAATDSVQAAYFRHAAEVARRRSSAFLHAWISFEVSLRNALAQERAKALGLSAEDYLVAADLGGSPREASQAVNEWMSASDPLEAMRALDRARWRWLTSNDSWYSFSDDELAAYAAKLVLLTRWQRISRAGQEDSSAAGAGRPTSVGAQS